VSEDLDKKQVSEDVDTRGDAVEAGAGPAALFGPEVDCEEAVHELYHYLDGELTEERRVEIRIHLDYCGPCGGAAAFEAELRRVVADRCKDRVPDSLIRRVAEAIDEESRQHHGGH
jgi:mycothiol system anti-sigma-R factor